MARVTNRDILERLIALQEAVNRLGPPSRATRADRVTLQHLLPVLYASLRDHSFLASEALTHDSVRAIWGSSNAKSFGRFLARVDGFRLGGLSLEFVGTEGHRRLWKISSLGVFGKSGDFCAA